jgi:hypothetical protein
MGAEVQGRLSQATTRLLTLEDPKMEPTISHPAFFFFFFEYTILVTC